jgi:hypothetical protein
LTVGATSSATLKLESTTTTLATGGSLGNIDFYSNDVGNVGVKARINTYSEDTVGSTSLRFKTTEGFSTALKDRLNLASNGDISFYEDTGTTAKLFWDASAESLGIGTSSPDKILHIKTAVNNTAFVRIESTATDSYPTLSLKNDAREYQLTAHGPLGDKFTIYDGTAGAHRFVIDSSGKVGIGTSSPGTTLDVIGTLRSFVSGGTPIVYLSNGTTQHSIQNTSGALTFFNDGTERMRINSSGVTCLWVRLLIITL